MSILFYASALVSVLSTLLAITRVNVTHALLYFIVSLLSLAIIFYTLGAHFAAALEVIVYAGAIMVFNTGEQVAHFHIGVAVAGFAQLAAFAHQRIDFIKLQNHLPSVSSIKQAADIFLGLTHVFAHQRREIYPK